ncbi:aldo/keto reductase [Prochlorococcus sp. MIT 0604]|uniref:aldo/keto reductase n=1 Tax=Prochlorococcus sp. MIT 0604 TaxID=1501268 RepID=UPI0004F67606|nr:aldo/keto reductase [Prochlorococcus sp. MIT 0604]AIQ95507.1 hypothetical protein EW14_1496 [Prochlorococcus sp. MIT 0604]
MVKLSLGCAQFGMTYGFTNSKGKVLDKEVEKIIDYAILNDIKSFDTAQSYGDSEEVLGNYICKYSGLKVTTKFECKSKNCFSDKDINKWENNFQNSLNKLRLNNIDSFLVHNVEDLKKDGKEILENWLNSLFKRKLINRIGISIYSSSDLNSISLDNIKLIQMPISLYDQRLIKNNTCSDLQKKNIAIHARSIFFQGLTLVGADKWPKLISKDFKSHHMNILRSMKSESILETSLSFIDSCKFIEKALIGVTCLEELKEIIEIKNNLQKIKKDFSNFSWNYNNDLDPRFWNQN